MAAPDISSYISSLPLTAVRGEIIPTHIFDRELEQYVWAVTVYVPKDFTPVGGPGVMAELRNDPRNSKESMLVLKFVDPDAALPPGVDGVIEGILGAMGIDELEKSEGFVDVIRVKGLVGNSFSAPPSTFTYKTVAYTLRDFELLYEDVNNRKLVAFYIRTARNYTDAKWFGNFGGVLGTINKGYSLTGSSPSVNFLTIDASSKGLEDGTFVTETFSNAGAAWPVITSSVIDKLGNTETTTEQIVAAGTVTPGVTINGTASVTVLGYKGVDYLRDNRINETTAITGPDLVGYSWDESQNVMVKFTEKLIPAYTITAIDPVVATDVGYTNLLITEHKPVDKWRSQKTYQEKPIADRSGEKKFGPLDVVEEVTGTVWHKDNPSLPASGAVVDAGAKIVTLTEHEKVDNYLTRVNVSVKSTEGPVLYSSQYNEELKKFVLTATQIVPYGTVTDSATLTNDTLVVIEHQDLDRWRTKKITRTLDLSGLDGATGARYKKLHGYKQLDLPAVVTGVNLIRSWSDNADKADLAIGVGFDMDNRSRFYPTEIWRFYKTDDEKATIDACITAATATLLDYTIKTKEILIGMSYWNSGSAVQAVQTPNAFWDSGISEDFDCSFSPFDVLVNPAGSTTHHLKLDSSDFTAFPTGRKVVDVDTKEWFGGVYVITLIVAVFP